MIPEHNHLYADSDEGLCCFFCGEPYGFFENGMDLRVWEAAQPEGIDEVLMHQVEDIARVGTQWYFRRGAEKHGA